MSLYNHPVLYSYATGHANGLIVGREQGYTNGWNEATTHANNVIEKRDQRIDKLYGANGRLAEENSQLKLHIQLQQEQAQSLRAEYEEMHMAFLGAVSIAHPAMKAVAKLPLAERAEILDQFCHQAVQLQSREYVVKNQYPSSQSLILKYLPIANQVFNQTNKQLQQLQQLQQQQAEPKAEPAK